MERLTTLKDFIKKVNIFLLTSISEGFPNVLLEAMSYGIPVVSSNVGGISDLIEHGENGLIFESNDLDSFYKNVIKLISDNGLRKKISQNAHKTINDRFALENMVKKYDKIFQYILIDQT